MSAERDPPEASLPGCGWPSPIPPPLPPVVVPLGLCPYLSSRGPSLARRGRPDGLVSLYHPAKTPSEVLGVRTATYMVWGTRFSLQWGSEAEQGPDAGWVRPGGPDSGQRAPGRGEEARRVVCRAPGVAAVHGDVSRLFLGPGRNPKPAVSHQGPGLRPPVTRYPRALMTVLESADGGVISGPCRDPLPFT